MKTLLISAAAVAGVVLIAPAIAQTAPAAQGQPAMHMKMKMQPMTRASVTQMVQQHFARLDSNKDGFVTEAEMDSAETAMHQKMEQRMQQRESDMFARMDTNKDGSISRAEFDAAHQAMAAGRMGDHEQMGMGRMAAMHGMKGGMGDRMFATADANKDGKVSLQEATSAALAHFDKLDANHDGTVTPDEMRAAHKQMSNKSARR